MDRSISSSPFSSGPAPCSSNQGREGRSRNRADTRAVLAPVRIKSRLVRSPMMAPIESITMDLPAPVSPVRTLKPWSKVMSAWEITAMFSMCSKLSM